MDQLFPLHPLQNHRVERLWQEVNSRINYPIKACLVDMEEKGQVDTDDDVHKFCISWFTLQVVKIGSSLFIASWNNHHIPSKCNCTFLSLKC